MTNAQISNETMWEIYIDQESLAEIIGFHFVN